MPVTSGGQFQYPETSWAIGSMRKAGMSDEEFYKYLEQRTMTPPDADIKQDLMKQMESSVFDVNNPTYGKHIGKAMEQMDWLTNEFRKGNPAISEAISDYEAKTNKWAKPRLREKLTSGKRMNRETLWELFTTAIHENVHSRLTDEDEGPEFGSEEYNALSQLDNFLTSEKGGRTKFDWGSVLK